MGFLSSIIIKSANWNLPLCMIFISRNVCCANDKNWWEYSILGNSKSILKIPQNVVTPYNAQATLHFYDAFWALYLPVTVAGRVSDIWRSYFTQALFPMLGLSIGFLPRPRQKPSLISSWYWGWITSLFEKSHIS